MNSEFYLSSVGKVLIKRYSLRNDLLPIEMINWLNFPKKMTLLSNLSDKVHA